MLTKKNIYFQCLTYIMHNHISTLLLSHSLFHFYRYKWKNYAKDNSLFNCLINKFIIDLAKTQDQKSRLPRIFVRTSLFFPFKHNSAIDRREFKSEWRISDRSPEVFLSYKNYDLASSFPELSLHRGWSIKFRLQFNSRNRYIAVKDYNKWVSITLI